MNMEERSGYLGILEYKSTDLPTSAELKKRWKDLCKKHHPDIGGDAEKFKEVTHAYKMLTDIDYATKHKPMERKHLDLRIQFAVTFEEAFSGTKVVMNYSVTEFDDNFNAKRKEELEIENLVVSIEEGSFSGDVVKIPGKGIRKGDRRGDLYLHPQVGAHIRFKAQQSMRGWDILSHESVPLHILLTGGKIDVLTMKGISTLKIPPGTRPGTTLVISGKGCIGGNHVVVVDAVYPDTKELKSSKWKGLDINWETEESVDSEEEDIMKILERMRIRNIGR